MKNSCLILVELCLFVALSSISLLYTDLLKGWQTGEMFAFFVTLALASCHVASLVSNWLRNRYKAKVEPTNNIADFVNFADPWESQRTLMLVSDQLLPQRPQLTKDSLLYTALILEEMGEQLRALMKCSAVASRESLEVARMLWSFDYESQRLQHLSQRIRVLLNDLEFSPINLPKSLAKELLDANTDIMVVVAGMSLASGLPGRVAHQVVAKSNLSKVNPKTGKIDKTPDGKWIKGSSYQPPELNRVLQAYYD